ncbi:STP1 protein [Plasmodium malariae]|uniref:STP1 protein n=1 Tax=Plasmodium malariae TaxID=5858 RepID=A0A1D3JIA2_PLAMA|nr:STP1 protein [Plasmodium malariae]SBT86098.1 STP1 protein [Plasmodium malariae]
MENCIPKHFTLSGMSGYSLTRREPFRTIRTYIQNKTNFLKTVKDKNLFRNECKLLADYVIGKMSPPKSISPTMWEALLKFYLNHYFKNLTKYGGCPMILKKEHKELLELKYKEEDFCKKRSIDLNVIETIKKKNSGKCENTCLDKCKTYNAWIKEMQKQFEEKKNLFERCYKVEPAKKTKKLTKESTCDIMNQETFKELSECITPNSAESTEGLLETEKKGLETQIQNTAQIIPKSHVQQEIDVPISPEAQTELELQNPPQPPPKLIKSEASEIHHSTNETKDSQSLADASLEEANSSEDVHVVSEDTTALPSPPFQDIQLSPGREITKPIHKSSTYTLAHSPPQIPHTPEHTIYDDEEIIKKIKINELTTNVNLSKRTRDRTKTIVEVHMEVLEEFRNKEWENNKDEFLEICIDEFKKEDNITYPNLIDDDLITENIKSSNDIKQQNILRNKWIESNRNISEKLKKANWFINLKNEWKKELYYIQEMEELKMKYNNEKHNVLFLQREKDIWKQWISKKAIIIEQYLEQECFNEFSEDFHNISDQYLNENTKNYISLMNIEEFQKKENYVELYKYVKKKLITRLCILVLMTILEECKKEVNFENRESYLDNSINESKKGVYSYKKPVITENIIKYNSNDLEYIKNKEIHAHIGNNTFRNEIENWVK